jgi:FkbM family methyltransferase
MKSGQLTPETSMVYDVGMHTGQDTAHYLRRGYNVVAFEANPDLVEQNTQRFGEAIAMGRLAIVYGAIISDESMDADRDTVDFYVNENSVWGTVVPDRASEYEQRSHSDAKVISVPRISFADALRTHGVPYYMKTDIEGVDTACLEGLGKVSERPAYVSLESDVDSFEKVRQELELFQQLGYNAFQIINQKDIEKNIIDPEHVYEYGASGDFGKWLPARDWMDARQTTRKYRELFLWYKLFAYGGTLRDTPLQKPLTKALSKLTGSTIPSWHDTHARHQDVE